MRRVLTTLMILLVVLVAGISALVLLVNPKVPAKNVQEFVAWLRSKNGEASYASGGNGTILHLAAEMFLDEAGATARHIPYKGVGPMVTDLIGGQVQVMFDILGSSLPHIQGGKLKPLAVTSAKRHPSLPNVPTMIEAGVPGYELTGWHGIAVRAGTPAPVIQKLNTTLNTIFSDPEFKKKWEAIGTPGWAAQLLSLAS